MKKLLIICILIVSLVFISGCASDEQTSSEIITSSQNNQESDTQNPELIIKQSDVPGLTLSSHNFYAVPKSTPDVVEDFLDKRGITEVNETIKMMIAMWGPTMALGDSEQYTDVLPIGTRNVGQRSKWSDESGRSVVVMLIKFDSSSFSKYYAEGWDALVDEINQNPQLDSKSSLISTEDVNNMVHLSIGDYCYYVPRQDPNNSDIQQTSLVLLYKNNYVAVSVTDETDESINEAKRIAQKIKSRLD